MKANEIYQEKADQIYAQIGHAVMQRKQIQEKIEDLEFKLKALVLSHPHLQEVEAKLMEPSHEPE
jgi:hypothetical protein